MPNSIGTIVNHHPFGSTTAREEVWDDGFIADALEWFEITEEEFEQFPESRQRFHLKRYRDHLNAQEEYPED